MAASIFRALVLAFLASVALAGENSEMSGLHLSDYKGFEKKWHPVTVRFRKDTGELRFVYANDKAWATLNRGDTNYPDGAVFAKIAVATSEDHSFTSSLVPSGARRYQLMVKDKKRYAETDGWGYGLFDSNGHTFPEDLKLTVQACAACHRIVAERGFVFSEPMHISPFAEAAKVNEVKPTKLQFLAMEANSLPSELRKVLPEKIKTVRSLQGPMREHLFQGTLDEIRPILAAEAVKAHQPAVLLSVSGDRFSVVFENLAQTCAAGVGLTGIHNIIGKPENYEISFCSPSP